MDAIAAEIAAELDRLHPDPRLSPADPERHRAVEEAERWGEEELHHPVRQISLWAMRAIRAPIRSYMERPIMGTPPAIAARLAPPFIDRGVRLNEATDAAVRAGLARFDSMPAGIEERIETGVSTARS